MKSKDKSMKSLKTFNFTWGWGMSIRFLMLAEAMVFASVCGAATRTWTGAGGDNEWTNTVNWTESKVPGIGDTAVFENTGVLSLRINRPSGYDVGATHFKFLGADVTIGSDNADNSLFFFGSSTCTVEVVAGTTVTCSNYLSMYNGDNIALAKKGGGTFRHVYRNNYIGNLKRVFVDEGRFEEVPTAAATYTIPASAPINVGDGADFHVAGYSSLVSGGAALVLDGGTLTAGLDAVPYWWFLGDDTHTTPDIGIGPGGGTVRASGYTKRQTYNSDNGRIRSYCSFSAADGAESDGGLTIDMRDEGVGFMPLAPFLLSGPVTVRDGRLLLARYSASWAPDLATHPSFFGTGDFTLDCGVIDYTSMSGTDLGESTLRLASGDGSAMRIRGSSLVNFRYSTANTVQHVVAGAEDAGENSVLACERGGALFLRDTGLVFDGSGSTFKVNGGVATNDATTLVKAPVFSDNASGGNGTLSFMCYDADKGFCEFTDYKADLSAGENAVVGGKIWPTLAANATAHIAALSLGEWASLTLNEGSRLMIGNGTDPACLLLSYGANVSGAGTIDFGSSEGVIAVGNMREAAATGSGGHTLPCRLTGSGGVSYVAPPRYGFRMVCVSGDNDYTGETHISAATVVARSATAFSSGDVHIDGGYRNGGKIVFDRPLAFANAFHASGAGHRLNEYDRDFFGCGALSFLTNDVVLAGAVELKAKTVVSALPAGAEGVLSGVVSGDRLAVMHGEGRVVLSGANTYTGGTEVVEATLVLAGPSPSLGTGRLELDDGTIVMENTSPVLFANAVEGTGTIKIKGADVVFEIPQIRGGAATTLVKGSVVEFSDGMAEVVTPKGFAIIVR